jgi:hypothetical protein
LSGLRFVIGSKPRRLFDINFRCRFQDPVSGGSRRREENTNSKTEQHGTSQRSAARPEPQQQPLRPHHSDNLLRPVASQSAAARDVPRSVHWQAEFLENSKESASLPRRLRILKPLLESRPGLPTRAGIQSLPTRAGIQNALLYKALFSRAG